MNSPRGGLRVAAFIFAIISLAHVSRFLAHYPIQIGDFSVPQWPSIVAVLLFGLLAIWFWRLAGKAAS